MSKAALASVPLQPGLIAIAAALLGIASLKDIAVRTIPDAVSLGLLAIGVAIRVADGNELSALVASSAVFVVTALSWRCGWLGGGDVKLVTACAWLVPPSLVPTLVLTTAVVGGVLACLYLSLSWLARPTSRPICRCVRNRSRDASGVLNGGASAGMPACRMAAPSPWQLCSLCLVGEGKCWRVSPCLG